MAVKSRSKSKKRPARKASKTVSNGKAKTNGNGHVAAMKDYEVITLRIDREHKSKLLDHCAKRAKQEGKQMSFNRAIIEWIERL